jgi:hypothetical protein
VGFTGSAGVDGYSGSVGLRGFTGFTGSKGDLGFTGSRGEGGQGYTGSVGAGSAGYTGSRGAVGFTGSKGDSGEFGAVGYVGSKGDLGFTGSQGNVGIGYAGSRGIDAAGYTGSVGFTGSQGPSLPGFTGSSGVDAAGFTGSRGAVGFTGSRGDLGTVGYTGSTGAQGAIGFTGSKGEDAVAGYRGSQGVEGYTGSRGNLGYTGSIGFTGSRGEVGYTGSRGDLGYTGSRGYTGSQGAGYTGSVGYIGSSGFTGSIGFTGSEGVRGQQGLLGYTGSVGAGTVGYSGSRGIVGYAGSQGSPGTGGLSNIPSSSAAAPGFPLAVDADTGLFGNTDNNIGISTGGTSRVLVNNTQTQITNELSGTTALFTSGSNQVSINTGVGSGTTNGLILNSEGNLEIIRSTGGAYIDFKNSATEDWDVRLASSGTAGIFTLSTAGTERLRVTETGLMGIGTTTPGYMLDVAGEIRTNYLTIRAQGGAEGGELTLIKASSGSTLIGNVIIDTISNRLRIFDSGSPNRGAYLDIGAAGSGASSKLIHTDNYSSYALPLTGGICTGQVRAANFVVDTNQYYFMEALGAVYMTWDGTNVKFNQNVTSTGQMAASGGFYTSNNVRADAIVLVGAGTNNNYIYSYTGNSVQLAPGQAASVFSKADGGNVNQIVFNNSNGQVGFINTNGLETNYGTSSDYRLKNSIQPMTNALETIKSLKPSKYKWNANGADGQGFIAHELQEIIPNAVSGEKDAVNEDGSIKPQGVDFGKIVVHLVAAMQEQQIQIDALKSAK